MTYDQNVTIFCPTWHSAIIITIVSLKAKERLAAGVISVCERSALANANLLSSKADVAVC